MRPLLVLALFALLAAPAAAQTPVPVDTTPTVAADGTGTATLTPDVADIALGVERVAPTSRAARNAANRRLAAVVRAVRARGVAAADVRTVGLTIQRERVKRRVRYRAAQAVVVHVRAVSGLGALIDAAAAAGADAIDDPEFGFADPSAGRTLATRAALADARRRADDAAAVAGLRITGVRAVDLDPASDSGFDDGGSTGSSGAGQKRAADVPTTVSPGTQDFTERVRVVYTAAPLA